MSLLGGSQRTDSPCDRLQNSNVAEVIVTTWNTTIITATTLNQDNYVLNWNTRVGKTHLGFVTITRQGIF